VVVGAGAIGVELAQALQEGGVSTVLIDAEKPILPNMMDPEMVIRPREELIRQGIHVVLNARISGLSGHEYVEHLRLENGEVIHFDDLDECSVGDQEPIKGLVVFATGSRPELSLVKDSPLKIGKDGIMVNSRMETNLPGVYACGDCVEFASGITGKIISGKLATNAVPMARVLAANLLGGKRDYPGFFNGAATKVGDYFVGGTGLTARIAGKEGIAIRVGYGETTSKFPMMPGTTPLRVKLVARAEDGKLLGGQVLSGEPVAARIDLLTYAIQTGGTVEDISALSYSAQPYQSFMPAASAVILAAEEILYSR
jgi:NADPH-dependent 2,4-dienoyl-CoA reductase/sulfur reductase-like enzyme